MSEDFLVDVGDDGVEIDFYLFFADEWAAMDRTFVVLDLEVTDLFDKQGEIMGISALLVNPQFQTVSMLDLLVKTKTPAPRWLVEELKLDQEEIVEKAIELRKALEAMSEFIAEHAVFIHNAPFDLQFLKEVFFEAGMAFKNEVFDTLAIAELTWPGQRFSIDGLAELLNIEQSGGRSIDVTNTLLQVLMAARQEAWGYHCKRLTTVNENQVKAKNTS